MGTRIHHQKNTSELSEVDILLALQLVLFEEGNDAFQEMLNLPHPVCHPVTVVLSNHTTTEIALECLEDLHIPLVLHDGELRQNLATGSHVAMLVDTDMKTTFTVDKADDPLCIKLHRKLPNVKSLRVPFDSKGPSLRIVPVSAGFLLTRSHMITLPHMMEACVEYRTAVEEFPAYGSVLLRLAIC
jgi:hypothetical protein